MRKGACVDGCVVYVIAMNACDKCCHLSAMVALFLIGPHSQRWRHSAYHHCHEFIINSNKRLVGWATSLLFTTCYVIATVHLSNATLLQTKTSVSRDILIQTRHWWAVCHWTCQILSTGCRWYCAFCGSLHLPLSSDN